MSEVTFAKQFLAQLDTKPVKLSSDYVADPRNLPAQPAYILPRQSHHYTKPLTATPSVSQPTTPSTAAATPAATLIITFTPLRRTADLPATLALPIASPARTSIYDLKTALSPRTGYAPDKLRLLWDKKPAPDSKTVAEVLGAAAGDGTVAMGVMFVGAPTFVPVEDAVEADGMDVDEAPPAGNAAPEGDEIPPVAQVPPGVAVLRTREFWEDLKGFVTQRVRDEEVAAELVRVCREAWHTEKEGRGPT